MKISEIQGNESLKTAFFGMTASGKIPHAIMLHEDDGGGALSVANAFLQYLFCCNREDGDSCGACPSCNKVSKMIHPDIHFIFPMTAGRFCSENAPAFREMVLENPAFSESDLNEAMKMEGKSPLINVEEAKRMLSTLSMSALEGGYRAVVIYLPEKMNQEAANRLLKIIEEPPQKTQFILITHAPEKVLQTISSRCQRFRVISAARSVDGDGFPEFAELMDALLSRNLFLSLDMAEKLSGLPSRESYKAFCRFAALRLRDIFAAQQGIGIPSDESVAKWAGLCRKTFPRAALDIFNRASMLVDRNVNAKILFTDMVDRLYYII